MNWFKRMVIKWVREDWENAREKPEDCYPSRGIGISTRSGDLSDNRPLTFNIYRASGGTIVELRKYDNRKDHWDNQLHVISDDLDFNSALSKIVTLEALRS